MNRGRILACACAMLMIASAVPLMICAASDSEESSPKSVNTIPGMTVIHQFKDTNMNCIANVPPPPCGAVTHVWNGVTGAKGNDGAYGTADDCPHCSAYCAPASIAMISTYRLRPVPFVQQDDIYDAGKTQNGEVPNNGIIETHGMGMFCQGLAPEVQVAFMWAAGTAIVQNDSGGVNAPLTGAAVIHYINEGRPILWCDIGGFPVNQSGSYPPPSYRNDQGHAKVIAGYDDSGTPGMYGDDWYLIYDPWPEYNDLGLKPIGAKKGPGGTWDPYWFPANSVLDANDIYLVDSFADVPEFSTMVIPVLSVIAIFILVARRKK